MRNATPLEILWTSLAVVGWIVSLVVLGGAAVLLHSRLREGRNGAIRLLAWQFVVDMLCITAALLAALVIGVVALILPARTEPLDGWLEYYVAAASGWVSAIALLVIVICLVLIAVFKFAIGLMLRRYYAADERKFTPERNPRRRHDDAPPTSIGGPR